MDANPDPLSLLARLYLAYPEKVHDPATVTLYLDSLADIPTWLLERAIQRHIETSEWFPKIADLRRIAARLANTSHFDTLIPPHPLERTALEAFQLIAAALDLEDAFFLEGRLDPAEWQALSAQFARLERPHRAAYTLEKLRRLQSVQAQQERASAPEP